MDEKELIYEGIETAFINYNNQSNTAFKPQFISNDYKVSVVVPYNDEARELLDKLSQDYLEIEEQKKILKKLQSLS